VWITFDTDRDIHSHAGESWQITTSYHWSLAP